MSTVPRLRVFLCHSSTDKPVVRDLFKLLSSENWIDPWLDEKSLRPGHDWKFEIEKAIDVADVVIVFLSRSSISKEGFIQKEIRYVLDKSDEKPVGTIYIIPIRVEECEIPKRFAQLQWLDVSIDNIDWLSKLLDSLKLRAEHLGVPLDQFDDENNELQSELRKVQRALEIKEIELRAVLAQAHEITNTDTLTWLPNRRKIMVDMQEEVVRAKRYNTSLSIIRLDLDDYNRIRETHGRIIGDGLLGEVAARMRELIRHPNTIGRLEGEEFLVVLPACNISDAIKLAENLCTRVRTNPIRIGELAIPVSTSVGVVEFMQDQESWEELLLRVDQATQKAKRNGGDRWATHDN